MEVPLREGDLDARLCQLLEDREVELAFGVIVRDLSDVDPRQQVKVDGGFLALLNFGFSVAASRRIFSTSLGLAL